MITRRILVAAVVVTSTLGAASAAPARTIYDGIWSVLIITDRGSCDRAYRYGISINDGIVRYRGDGSFVLHGRVNRGGRVQVSISRGSQVAQGSGRLTPNAGSGSWVGRSPDAVCAGHWIAERR